MVFVLVTNLETQGELSTTTVKWERTRVSESLRYESDLTRSVLFSTWSKSNREKKRGKYPALTGWYTEEKGLYTQGTHRTVDPRRLHRTEGESFQKERGPSLPSRPRHYSFYMTFREGRFGVFRKDCDSVTKGNVNKVCMYYKGFQQN